MQPWPLGKCLGAAVLALFVPLLGCGDDKAKAGATTDETIAAPGDQSDLLGRRDALLETRRALALKRAELDAKRVELAASGEDITLIDKQVSDLRVRETAMVQEEATLVDEILRRFTEQQAQLASVAGQLGGDSRMAFRERAVAGREGEVAGRERALADREKGLAARESELATKWKDSCAVGGPLFSMPAASSGTKYRKKDVEKHLKSATAAMRKRGILLGDLSAPLRNAMRAAEKAMQDGDYTQAYYMAEQLAGGISSLVIDRGFVMAKFKRVNDSVSGTLSDSDAKLLGQITSDYSDGRYESANRRLNELISRQ